MFPDLDADRVHAAVRARWDLSGPLPVPSGDWLTCPVCGGPPQARYWLFHTPPGPRTVPWRCDVSFKCTGCSAVWEHGVPVDRDMFRRHARSANRRIGWREAKAMLESQ